MKQTVDRLLSGTAKMLLSLLQPKYIKPLCIYAAQETLRLDHRVIQTG